METEISLKDKTTRLKFQPQVSFQCLIISIISSFTLQIKKYRDDYNEVLQKLANVEKEYMEHLDQQRLFERKDSKVKTMLLC